MRLIQFCIVSWPKDFHKVNYARHISKMLDVDQRELCYQIATHKLRENLDFAFPFKDLLAQDTLASH